MRQYPTLDILPAELQLDETELDLSSSGSGNAILSEWDKRMLIAKWIDTNNIDEDYDYIIFDCPPATKIVTQNAIGVSHGYFIPTIPDSVSIRGIPHLIDRMFEKIDEKFAGLATYLRSTGREIYRSYIPRTELLGILIFRIRVHGPAYSGYVSDHTIHLRQLEGQYKRKIIKPYIEEGVGVSESLSDRLPVYDRAYNKNVSARNYVEIFKSITEECKNRIDAL
jgi:chromosome partitioning protein